jgi:hypothetical protein
MGISVIGGATTAAVKVLNKSQVFTTSGTWTAPTGVTYAQVQLRGGNGSFGGMRVTTDNGVNSGTAGGTTSAFSVSAVGGESGDSGTWNIGNSNIITHDTTPGNGPATVTFFANTTPGTGYAITIGSGTGAFAVVSWAE